MIGFNGGLIGKDRTTTVLAARGVWTLSEQIKAQRSGVWPTLSDPDALAYIAAVEAADGQTLESGVKDAINNFVVGCKADDIWSAIKASCILAGARTLAGALVPLVSTMPTPTNNNFVSGDYNRETGLVGNGTTKFLGSNRNNNADPQNSNHNAIYVSTAATGVGLYMGASVSTSETGDNNFGREPAGAFFRNRNSSATSIAGAESATGFIGTNRSTSVSYVSRVSGNNQTNVSTSQTPFNSNISVFKSGTGGSNIANGRLAFYSIGESLDLALLDSRVTTLISDIAAAIP